MGSERGAGHTVGLTWDRKVSRGVSPAPPHALSSPGRIYAGHAGQGWVPSIYTQKRTHQHLPTSAAWGRPLTEPASSPQYPEVTVPGRQLEGRQDPVPAKTQVGSWRLQRQHQSTEPPAVKRHLGPEEETRPRRHQGSVTALREVQDSAWDQRPSTAPTCLPGRSLSLQREARWHSPPFQGASGAPQGDGALHPERPGSQGRRHSFSPPHPAPQPLAGTHTPQETSAGA